MIINKTNILNNQPTNAFKSNAERIGRLAKTWSTAWFNPFFPTFWAVILLITIFTKLQFPQILKNGAWKNFNYIVLNASQTKVAA